MVIGQTDHQVLQSGSHKMDVCSMRECAGFILKVSIICMGKRLRLKPKALKRLDGIQ